MNNETITLALLSGKGGSGKTVLALSMSKILAEAGLKVLLIDFDIATHGATYFFESELKKNTLSLIDLFNQEIENKMPIETKEGFDFLPSTTNPEQSFNSKLILNINELESILSQGDFLYRYNVIIFDCQAGYSPLVQKVAEFSQIKLIVLEPDTVSASALRVLYIQVGKSIGRTDTWQIFNKLTEDERQIYEKASGTTLFPNLPPIPFDWKVRASFATCDIPSVTKRTSAFGLGVLRIMKTIFSPFSKNLEVLERKTVGDWHGDIKKQVETLANKKLDYEYRDFRSKQKEQFIKIGFISGLLAFIGLSIFISSAFPLKINKEIILQGIGILIFVIAFGWYFFSTKELRQTRDRVINLESLKEIEMEMERYTTLLTTDPGLREYHREVEKEEKVKKEFDNKKLVFVDDFDSFVGWLNYNHGLVTHSNEFSYEGKYSLKKDKYNDPNGGYKILPLKLELGILFSGWIYRPSGGSGGKMDRIALEDSDFDGYGFGVSHQKKIVQIERRKAGKPTAISMSEFLRPIQDEWYKFEFSLEIDGVINLILKDTSGEKLASVSVTDYTFNIFDRIVIHGGNPYYIANLKIESL